MNVFVLRDFFMTDIVTNSSSEVFVMSENTREDAVRELVNSWIDEDREERGWSGEYDDIYYIERINADNFKTIVGYLMDWPKKRSDESYEEHWRRVDDAKEKFFIENFNLYKNKFAVWSTWDNTIPWEVIEKLEEISERRIHLG